MRLLTKKIVTAWIISSLLLNSILIDWTFVYADNSSINNSSTTQETNYFITNNEQLNNKLQKIAKIINEKIWPILDDKLYNIISNLSNQKQFNILNKINNNLLIIKNNNISNIKNNRENLKLLLKYYIIKKFIESIKLHMMLLQIQIGIDKPLKITSTPTTWNTAPTTWNTAPTTWTVNNVPDYTIEQVQDWSIPTTNNVKLLKITFNLKKLWDKQIKIQSAKLKLKWLIQTEMIKNVYFTDKNWMVIWNDRMFNTNNEVNFNMWYSNDIIDKNNNVIYLVVDINNQTPYWNAIFSISWQITTNQNTIKFNTNQNRIIKYTPQIMAIQWYAWINTVYVWNTTKLWQFDITVWSSTSTNNVLLKTIILDNIWNSSAKDVKNIVLKDSNWNIVAKSVKINKDYVALKFNDNYIIKDWDTQTFYIYWDIVDWQNGDTIEYKLDKSRDLIWYETLNSKIPVNTKILVWESFWKNVIQTWKMIISKSNLSNTDSNVAVWTKKSVLKFNVYTPQNIYVDDFNPSITITNNSSWDILPWNIFSVITLNKCDTNYQNCNSVWTLDIYGNGNNNLSPIWQGQTRTFQMRWYISEFTKGNNNYDITIKTFSMIPNWISFSLNVSNKSLDNPTNVNNNDISFENISWIASSNVVHLVTPKTQISYNNPYWTLEYIKWAKDISFWDFNILPNLSNIKLNNITFQIYEDTSWATNTYTTSNDINYNNIQASLYNNWTLVDTETVQPSWFVTFNKIISFDKDKVSKLELKISTDTSLYNWTWTKVLKAKIANSSNLTLITDNWLRLNYSNYIWHFPIVSNSVTIYPSANLIFSKQNDITKPQIFFWEDFNKIFSYKVKPKYDNVKLQDLYIKWQPTSNLVSEVEYSSNWINKTSSFIDGKASLMSVNNVYKKWVSNLVSLYVKWNKISDINQDNTFSKICLNLNWTWTKSKYISITNWNIIPSTNYIQNNILCSMPFYFRKSMIAANWNMSGYSNEITSNNTEYTLYNTEIKKLDQNNNSDLIKQITFQINPSVNTWDINIWNFKLETSVDWTNYTTINNNNIEFQVVKQWDSFTSTWYLLWGSWANITSSWENNYLVTARFTWNYINWFSFNNILNIKLKATLGWFDSNEWLSVTLSNSKEDSNMYKYADLSTWTWPYNSIIWSDNANPNNTKITDKNRFWGLNVVNDNIQNNNLYKK